MSETREVGVEWKQLSWPRQHGHSSSLGEQEEHGLQRHRPGRSAPVQATEEHRHQQPGRSCSCAPDPAGAARRPFGTAPRSAKRKRARSRCTRRAAIQRQRQDEEHHRPSSRAVLEIAMGGVAATSGDWWSGGGGGC